MKKMISICILSALSALLLSACGGGERPDDSLRIGVALYSQDDTFISALAQDLAQLAQVRSWRQQIFRRRMGTPPILPARPYPM